MTSTPSWSSALVMAAAIAASRLARAGQSVCLLERGRELHPGDFPRTSAEAERQLHLADGPRHIGDQRNLFTFHIGADMNVLTGCGLGGTSLINANVSLRPLERVLDDPLWPAALRADRAGLVAGYERAEEMLQPETYPALVPPSAQGGGAAALGRRGAVQAHAHQRHLPGRGQPGRRPPGRLQRVWRLRDRVQLRGQEHPADELSARRGCPRGRGVHRGGCPLRRAGGRRLGGLVPAPGFGASGVPPTAPGGASRPRRDRRGHARLQRDPAAVGGPRAHRLGPGRPSIHRQRRHARLLVRSRR